MTPEATDIPDLPGTSSTMSDPQREVLLRSFATALGLAASISTLVPAGGAGVALALNAAVQTVGTLLMSASIRCNRTLPPADVGVRPDSSGDLVYICDHDPPHRWDLGGKQLP